ncbi:MAG: acetyl-CoA carboxylase carboxyltransferase subunit alpha [Polycyclovorans sp.]|jgi:acetyl-CoA carboxylase carboxyl transferase subunit alpha|nr:acetyl-CoA carboxylase carboxyl transferase subunit alpha [Polycyclovorans sp.]MBU0790182.1 acetyl-CoA carboxylase carboxyltransferase subunit alpha [Gammaproteobacteria bacterium]MDP1543225.1 acetyl-CoA carboxylase carboxyltransferase subunit alpha [Polycyclovorans sp.]MEC8850224.1 acetyl-CoA carboxylase carboxyltransferase subunit alpha [Pseudomonadota bacterium]|tara:strand:+ start:2011 stop:2976 length:966 start_codon:yes stop_codon:yes gene_type:complete
MKPTYLDFEQPIAELDQRIEDLRFSTAGRGVDLNEEITRLEAKSRELTAQIFGQLTPWQVAQVARHPQRPYSLDYLQHLFTDWEELHGDRHFRDDPSMICGVARFEGRACVVLGQQKGRDAKERVYRNFGMPKPEGYRKALRLMQLAERFHLPIFTFIDTPGAYPGIGAEERNQSEAIARNLFEMARLRTPVIATVIGEGGSGGALAIGVADHVIMLSNSIYSVISPEGCASILFKSAARAPEAAEAMKITAQDLLGHKLIDEIVAEPLGGAHRDVPATMESLRLRLSAAFEGLRAMPMTQLAERRHQRLMSFGAFELVPA